MARIHLKGVGHAYDGGRAYALEKTDLVFEDGMTYALLGPSGCGKTTMLNIISGLLFPSDGQVMLGERDVTRTPTARRNIAQVFQFPVVYQSKTVFGNLAFPLKCRRWDKARIAGRVEEIAVLLGLSARLGQSARRLTADEKQLVSLGRGLVRDDVAALLMDEPLTVIDPQQKLDLRRRIKQANARTRNTVIYVTHDQNEAMTFADEILVMRAGRVVQRGTPKDLFERPCDAYVGNFIGSPGMNFIPAARDGDQIRIGDAVLLSGIAWNDRTSTGPLTIGVRPEYLSLVEAAGIPATIVSVQDQGGVRILECAIATGRIKMKLPRSVQVLQAEIQLKIPPHRAQIYLDGRLLDPNGA